MSRRPFHHLPRALPLALLTACGDPAGQVGAPIIQSVTATPAVVSAYGQCQLACVAVDLDGDSLAYSWTCGGGDFPDGGEGSLATWTAPGEQGEQELRVDVCDGLSISSGTVVVTVEPAAVPADLLLIAVPAGEFQMGREGVAEPVHEVTLSHGYLLGKTEVTHQQFLAVLHWAVEEGLAQVGPGTVTAHGVELVNLDHEYCQLVWRDGSIALGPLRGGHGFGGSPAAHPVMEVTWYGAACFCDWLTLLEGGTPFYNGDWEPGRTRDPYTHQGYRLPTEAEWEYAARYPGDREYPWGPALPDCIHANCHFEEPCEGWTLPVGSCRLGESALGFQDLAGNVWEWVHDWWGGYSTTAVEDPFGPSWGSLRVTRGGGWSNEPHWLRTATRGNGAPAGSSHSLGFRVCRSL